ncbi:hypothetical protein QU516_10165 [Moellerella wisconsensis]|uniref:phage tail fiber protein n=1 Tax=Moellerella wisconsensis TaxID=158849 RepID=UPI0025B21100|nr:hypothetical protein [Moellerella wisconsensis]WJW81018.1 hypothetical protein QU516_10165 [Moellerella wisconsensis]
MTLSFPVPATVKEATYNILTTMVHSVSDAANKIVAMNNANVQFSDILNRWATETGTITVTLPDGTKQQLRTAKEMDKQLDGKFDKVGGMITASNQALAIKNADDKQASYFAFLDASGYRRALIGYVNGTDDLAFSNTRAGLTFKLTSDGKALIGNSEVVLAGDFGLGDSVSFSKVSAGAEENPFGGTGAIKITGSPLAGGYNGLLYMSQGGVFKLAGATTGLTGIRGSISNFYSDKNTTKDSNGNLKAASPIVKVFADYIELNEESEGVELKCLHTGIYQLKHVLGLNSDASWGGINGGITIPSGINQLPLIYVDYDVLVAGEQHPFNGEPVPQEEHGDIVIYTSYRKHFDLPQNVQRARLKTYPEFTKLVGDERVELENGAPVDIPAGHWIDVRVNMPSNSIYNQKQAEAEAYAKEEVERLEREAIEEAERIEREEIERLEREEADRVAEEAERESYESNDGDLLV